MGHTGLQLRCGQGWRLQEESVSWPFPLLEAACMPPARPAPASLLLFVLCHSDTDCLLPPSSAVKDPWNYTGLTGIIQDNLPILKSLISNLNWVFAMLR